MRRCLFFLLIFSLSSLSAYAEHLPFSFRNNKIRVLADRSSSNGKSVILLKVKAPESSGFQILEANHPARIVIDFRAARTTRNRTFSFSDSEVLRSIRCGVHPGFLRVVLDFQTMNIPAYSYKKDGDWFILTVTEAGEKKSYLPYESSSVEQVEQAGLIENFSLQLQGWNKINQDTKKDSETEQTLTDHLELRPEIDFDSENGIKGVLSAESNMFFEWQTDSADDIELKLFEGYLAYGSDWYNLRAGNQIVSWGKSDEISPLDNVNPEDLRDGYVRERAERKIPVPMMNLELMEDVHRLQLLYLPTFRRSRIDLAGSEWALFGDEPYENGFQSDVPESGEFGARYTLTFDDFDLGFSFLSSYSDLPVFSGDPTALHGSQLPDGVDRGDLIALARSQGQTVDLEYPRQNVFGIEYETVYESIGIRGDIAYKDAEYFVTRNFQQYDSETLIWTIGADWLSIHDLYINLQYSQTSIHDYDDSLLFARELQHGVYGEFYKEFWYNKLRAGIQFLYGFPLEQQYYNPYIRILYWDRVNFEVGADLIEGDSTSPLGFYGQNDQYYFLTRFYF